MPQSMVPLALGNFALAQIIRDTTGLRVATVLAVAAFAIALGVVLRARASAQQHDLLLIGLGAVIGLLGSPLVWMHYLVMALPLLACLARGRRRLAVAVALTLLAVTPWDQVIPTTLLVAALVNAGLRIAFVAGFLDLAAPEAA
jgi:hypothetical protein